MDVTLEFSPFKFNFDIDTVGVRSLARLRCRALEKIVQNSLLDDDRLLSLQQWLEACLEWLKSERTAGQRD